MSAEATTPVTTNSDAAPTKAGPIRRVLYRSLTWVSRNRDVVQFCAMFVALTVILNLIYSHYEQSEPMLWYSEFNARMVEDVYAFLGLTVYRTNYTVTVNGFAMSIAPVCTALTTMIIYFACIVAYPASFGKKLLGLLLGIPSLALVNFGRLLLLGYLGYTNQKLFDLVHLYVFQVVFIVFVIVLWLTWIDKIVQDASKDALPA
jgi:exosortase/archaeosortase family protein